jgi:hypothetical protein
MNYTDTQRLDFLEKWEVSNHQNSWFSLLTQHIRKEDCPKLRDFCDYGIQFEEMINTNGFDIISWYEIPLHLQEMVLLIWENEKRSLSEEEKLTLQEETNNYWAALLAEDENKDFLR